jgi:hypothetical protein
VIGVGMYVEKKYRIHSIFRNKKEKRIISRIFKMILDLGITDYKIIKHNDYALLCWSPFSEKI